MSVRQYIGSRYVPIFADPLEWDGTRTYEQLTVVLHQGNSYTSRQPVPAGIEITNTTYWAQTGSYSAQTEQYRQETEQYRQEVTAFDGRITANANAISAEATARVDADTALSGRIDANAGAISAEATARADADTANANAISAEATARVDADTALDERIDAIAQTTNDYAGYNYVAIGDSFTSGSGVTSESERYPNIIAEKMGMTLFNFGITGSGFWDESPSGNANFQHQLERAISEMSAEEIANTKLLTIFGGYNDYQTFKTDATPTQETVISMAVSEVQYARTHFPNARIFVIPMNWACYEFDNIALVWYSEMCDTLQKLPVANVSVIENAPFWNLGMLSKYASTIHPNAAGYANIAGCIINAICGGSQFDVTSQEFTTQAQNVTFNSHTVSAKDGIVTLEIGGLTVGQDSQLTEDTIIGQLPDRYIPQFQIQIPLMLNFTHFGVCRVGPGGNIAVNRARDANYSYPTYGEFHMPSVSWNMFAKQISQDG